LEAGSAASRAKRTEAAAYLDVLLGCLNVGKLEAGSRSLKTLTFFAKRTEAAAYLDVLLGFLNVGKLEAGSRSLQS
jgi:hypothetical protein